MEVSKQCCSLEQAKRLKELGAEGESLFGHFTFRNESSPEDQWGIVHHTIKPSEMVEDYEDRGYLKDLELFPAYTVAELGEMLPTGFDTMRLTGATTPESMWHGYDQDSEWFPAEAFKTEAECRAAMIIKLIETEKLTPSEINNRLSV